ncbi:MAG TPA: hypothetical protein VGE78_00290, partial [Agromyces sp.]
MFKRISKNPPAPMPQRRRTTFRAPGAIDPALLAEGAEALVDGTGEGASFGHTTEALEPAGTREDSAEPDPAEPSLPARARRGFVAAKPGRGVAALETTSPDAGTPQGPGSVPPNPGPPESRRTDVDAHGPVSAPASDEPG